MNNRKRTLGLLIAVITLISISGPLPLEAKRPATENGSSAPQWSIQVEQVDPAGVNIESSFQVAIYESLLEEIGRTRRFQHVFRHGDRNASGVPTLLVLKTKIQKYTQGSETQRAVTTVSGATKLTVLSQLCTPDGKVVFEHTVTGNVRFLGSNLKATRNLAHNVADMIKRSSLPTPPSLPAPSS
jgi:hypothetical protein